MTTKSLRDILRKATERDLGFKVRVAGDIHGPGGGVFIANHTELNERHLTWLEQRNPAPGASTFVEVVFTQDHPSPTEVVPHEPEAPANAAARRRRAEELSQEVGKRAEVINRQALEIYRIIGEEAFGEGALRNPKVRDNLRDLDQRLQGFHTAVHAALDEYLSGSTLIMGLISQYDPGTRAVTHGLNVAVLATELASQILLKDNTTPPDDVELKKELAEVFVGGFIHDCGLWSDAESASEGHEAAGARLIWHLPELRTLAPALVNILLFHSDALRMTTRSGLVCFVHHPDDAENLRFKCEFFASEHEAERAAKGHHAATQLDEGSRRRVLAVAMAEYCISQTEGFHARSLTEVIARLAHEANEGLYVRYIIALCNIQVETIAPRRAYIALSGHMPTRDGESLDLEGFAGGSLLHGNDASSPHLIILSRQDADGKLGKLAYVNPQDGRLWARQTAPASRFYLPAGRYDLGLLVTGFMSEATYANILAEYEHALKGQMQA